MEGRGLGRKGETGPCLNVYNTAHHLGTGVQSGTLHCKFPMVIKMGDCQTIKNYLKLIKILKINQA